MKKRILVTGAAGFIGFHLIQHLHKRGDIVVGYDNFNDYYDPRLKQARADYLDTLGISIVKGDICDNSKLLEVAREHQVECIAHMAAQAGVRYSLANPQAYVHSNIEGFVNILELCKKYNCKLIYASSSSVYGTNSKIPFSESDSTDHPASFYGATKKANECMAYSYHHMYGIQAIGLRFFTVYGPWGRPDMAYYSFSKAITKGQPIELYNHGQMQRDFTYIDDIVDGIVAAIDLEASYELFNLGNHRPEKLMTLVTILETLLEKKAELILMPMQPGDVVSTYADIEQSRQKLNFKPKTSLEDGLEKFVGWFKSYNKTCLPTYTISKK